MVTNTMTFYGCLAFVISVFITSTMIIIININARVHRIEMILKMNEYLDKKGEASNDRNDVQRNVDPMVTDGADHCDNTDRS